MNKASDSVLYFPSIEFKSDDWIKSSLLYWDKIYRIVPRGYTPRDSVLVQKACQHGLIENITLESEDKSKTADEFITFYDNLEFIPAGLEPTEGLHPEKIDERLYPLLEKIAQKLFNDNMLLIPKPVVRGYMFYLSKVVAERRNLNRGTDDRDSWAIDPYFAEDANFGEYTYDRDAKWFYSSLFIYDLFPADISNVPIEDIIHFIEERKELKVEFRNKIFEFVNELAKYESEGFTKAKIEGFIEDIETSKKSLKKAIEFQNVRSNISNLFSVGLPISLAVYNTIKNQSDPFSIYTLLGSISIGAIASYLKYAPVKKERENYHLSYLIDMDRELVGKKVYPNYPYLFDQFIND